MKKVALVWWWTWGHITPLLSIFRNMSQENGFDFFWVWESDSLEQKIALENNIRFYPVRAWKLRRYLSFKTFFEPFKIILGIFDAISILKKESPDLIFSKWWYVSMPVAIASKILWIKLFLHESDTVAWLANRYVWMFAQKVFLGFKEASIYFEKEKVEVVWQVLNPDLFNNEKTIISENEKTNLLIVAWSQWSTRIFQALLWNTENLKNFHVSVTLWSLNTHFRKDFSKLQDIEIYDFVDQKKMWELYSKADLAITRAWATSLAELEAFWVKMIIIPLSESANNHQVKNAWIYETKENEVLLEQDLNRLKDVILKYEWYKKNTIWNPKNTWLETICDFIRSFNLKK